MSYDYWSKYRLGDEAWWLWHNLYWAGYIVRVIFSPQDHGDYLVYYDIELAPGQIVTLIESEIYPDRESCPFKDNE
jgi:hypothetical protein